MTALKISIEKKKKLFLIVPIDRTGEHVTFEEFITQCKDLAQRQLMLLGNHPIRQHTRTTANEMSRNCCYLRSMKDLTAEGQDYDQNINS